MNLSGHVGHAQNVPGVDEFHIVHVHISGMNFALICVKSTFSSYHVIFELCTCGGVTLYHIKFFEHMSISSCAKVRQDFLDEFSF